MGPITELADKMSDNLILTTSATTAGSASALLSLPHEITVGVIVAIGILVRLILEHAWARHCRRHDAKVDQARREYARQYPHKVRAS